MRIKTKITSNEENEDSDGKVDGDGDGDDGRKKKENAKKIIRSKLAFGNDFNKFIRWGQYKHAYTHTHRCVDILRRIDENEKRHVAVDK